MARFFWICLGGAVGTGARYLLSTWILRTTGPGFPWGTLAVNLIGSFLLGFLVEAARTTGQFSPHLLPIFTVGFLGGFTTYSTFNYETLFLLQEKAALGFLNLGATVLGCLAAGALGLLAGRTLFG